MRFFKHTAGAFVGIMVLTACGGGPNGGNALSSKPSNPTTINSYIITGTSPTTSAVQPINAGVNGGDFNVSWNVSSTDPYHVDLYVSYDATLSKTDDIKFFGQNCGSSSSIYNCDQNASFPCTFTGDNKLSCGTVSAANPQKDLGSFLINIPQSAYVIMEACNGLFTDCTTSSIAVEFQ